MDINEVNDHLALRLESYAETFSHKLTRHNLLNERAKVRNNYFINVILLIYYFPTSCGYR